MSLYNALFGRNPAASMLLAMLGLGVDDVGRFRDCYLRKESDGSLRIVVFTRNGGGNREEYEPVTEALRSLPTFVTDFDDDFDCTYASYVFEIPEQFRATAEGLTAIGAEPGAPMDQFKALLDKLRANQVDDPLVQRALSVGESILGPVREALAKDRGES